MVNTAYLAIGGVLVVLSVVVVVAVLAVIFVKYEKNKPTPTPPPSGGGGGDNGGGGTMSTEFWIAGTDNGKVFLLEGTEMSSSGTWDLIIISLRTCVTSIVPLPGSKSFLVLLTTAASTNLDYANCLKLVSFTDEGSMNLSPVTLSTELPTQANGEWCCNAVSDGRNVHIITNFGNVVYKNANSDFSKAGGWIRSSKLPLETNSITNLPCPISSRDSPFGCVATATRDGCAAVFSAFNDPDSVCVPSSYICSPDGSKWKKTGYDNENTNGEVVSGATFTQEKLVICGTRSDIFTSPSISGGKSAFDTLGDKAKWDHPYNKSPDSSPFRGIAYNNTTDDTLVAIYNNDSDNGALVFANASTKSLTSPTQVKIFNVSDSPPASIASDGKIFAAVSTSEGFFYYSDLSAGPAKPWIEGPSLPFAKGAEKVTILKHSSNVSG